MGDCIMPREGVFARVLEPGTIHVGDEMVIEPRKTPRPWQAAVITLSDKGARGERKDESGPAIVRRLEESGYEVVEQILLADEQTALKAQLIRLADQRQLDLILTTGGTGFSPRDTTPEATLAVATRLARGIAEAVRAASMQFTKHAMLSRAQSVIRGKTLIINRRAARRLAWKAWMCSWIRFPTQWGFCATKFRIARASEREGGLCRCSVTKMRI